MEGGIQLAVGSRIVGSKGSGAGFANVCAKDVAAMKLHRFSIVEKQNSVEDIIAAGTTSNVPHPAGWVRDPMAAAAGVPDARFARWGGGAGDPGARAPDPRGILILLGELEVHGLVRGGCQQARCRNPDPATRKRDFSKENL